MRDATIDSIAREIESFARPSSARPSQHLPKSTGLGHRKRPATRAGHGKIRRALDGITRRTERAVH